MCPSSQELDSLPLFAELGLLLPAATIRVVMVGPEVRGPKEMIQPCLICLYAISLIEVLHAKRRSGW